MLLILCRDDAELVKEIIKRVSSMMFNLRQKVNSKECYAVGKQFSHAQPLLQLKSEDVPIIGMTGIDVLVR